MPDGARSSRKSRAPNRQVSLRLTSYRSLDQKPDRFPTTSISRNETVLLFGRPNRKPSHPGSLPAVDCAPRISTTHLSLTLPVPPSINHQYATVNGRRLLSATGRHYKMHVGQKIMVALANSPHRSILLKSLHAEYLALSIRFYFTSRLRRDVDGGLKIAQDALCEALEINDNRIVETHLYKDLDKVSPRIEVSLYRASDAEAPRPMSV